MIKTMNENTQVYETSFLLVSTLAEEKIPTVFGAIKSLLEKQGATFVSEELPKMKPLAYTMVQNEYGKNTKFNFAYFGWVKYELPTENADEVKSELLKNKDVLRFLTIKTVKENTVSGFKLAKKRGDEKTSENPAINENSVESAGEVNEAEVGEAIDKLVE
jgi:ribosomal protein S6